MNAPIPFVGLVDWSETTTCDGACYEEVDSASRAAST